MLKISCLKFVPTDCSFTAIGHVLSDGQSGTITAHLFPDILPNKPGVYRFFYEENIDGNNVLLMTTFELEWIKRIVAYENTLQFIGILFICRMLAELSEDLGEAMVGINEQEIALLMAERGK